MHSLCTHCRCRCYKLLLVHYSHTTCTLLPGADAISWVLNDGLRKAEARAASAREKLEEIAGTVQREREVSEEREREVMRVNWRRLQVLYAVLTVLYTALTHAVCCTHPCCMLYSPYCTLYSPMLYAILTILYSPYTVLTILYYCRAHRLPQEKVARYGMGRKSSTGIDSVWCIGMGRKWQYRYR
jgi:hypothetical protein